MKDKKDKKHTTLATAVLARKKAKKDAVYTRPEPGSTAKEVSRRLKDKPDHLADGMEKHNEAMRKKWAKEKSKGKKKKGLFSKLFGSKDD